MTQTDTLPKIYAFCNGGSPGWYRCDAISEDGVFLAGHICSDPAFGPYDLGRDSTRHHETYRKYYPEGFEVIWIEDVNDDRLQQAHARHKAMTPDEYRRKGTVLGEPDEPKVEIVLSEGD